MDPLIVGAGIAAAGNAVASGMSSAGNKKAAKIAARHNLKMWNLQNAYNTPTAQMARLKDAGLNPHLIYGQGASGATGMADKIAEMKPWDASIENPINDPTMLIAAKQQKAQISNLESLNTKNIQETALKSMQTSKLLQDKTQGSQMFKHSLEAAKMNVQSMELESKKKLLEYTRYSDTQKDAILEANYRMQNARENLRGSQLTNELRQLQKELKQIGIEPSDNLIFRAGAKMFNYIKERKYFEPEMDQYLKDNHVYPKN